MIGCITLTATSPCVKSASPAAKLLLALHTVTAPSGEERTLDAAAQVERAKWCGAAALTVARTRAVAMPLSWCTVGLISLRAYSGPRVSERLHSRSAVLWAAPRILFIKFGRLGGPVRCDAGSLLPR
jgi:hypothetical protein